MLGKLTNIDRNDPASMQQARDAVAQLKNSNFAKLLGVKPGDLDNAVKYVDDALPQAGDTPAQTAARLKTLDEKLQGIASPTGMKAFDKGTLPGQLLRTVGLAAAGVSFVNSANKALDDPSLKNDLKVLVDAAGLGQKGAELLVGLGRVSDETRAGKIITGIGGGWKVAGRVGASEFLGVVGSAFDVWNAVDAANKGDGTSAALYGTGAAGGLMAALGSGPSPARSASAWWWSPRSAWPSGTTSRKPTRTRTTPPPNSSPTPAWTRPRPRPWSTRAATATARCRRWWPMRAPRA